MPPIHSANEHEDMTQPPGQAIEHPSSAWPSARRVRIHMAKARVVLTLGLCVALCAWMLAMAWGSGAGGLGLSFMGASPPELSLLAKASVLARQMSLDEVNASLAVDQEWKSTFGSARFVHDPFNAESVVLVLASAQGRCDRIAHVADSIYGLAGIEADSRLVWSSKSKQEQACPALPGPITLVFGSAAMGVQKNK
jgi:hypothetical protein